MRSDCVGRRDPPMTILRLARGLGIGCIVGGLGPGRDVFEVPAFELPWKPSVPEKQ